jgi:hypothetical protein
VAAPIKAGADRAAVMLNMSAAIKGGRGNMRNLAGGKWDDSIEQELGSAMRQRV